VEDENKYDPAAHLSFHDISVDNADNPKVICLLIKQSKTDQGRVGVRVILGKTDDDLYPVLALLEYLEHRGGHQGALFQWEDRTPLSKSKFIEATQVTLTVARLPAKYVPCRSELQNRCSYNCSCCWSGRLYYSDSGTLEELILPALHSDQSSTTSSSVPSFAEMYYLMLSLTLLETIFHGGNSTSPRSVAI